MVLAVRLSVEQHLRGLVLPVQFSVQAKIFRTKPFGVSQKLVPVHGFGTEEEPSSEMVPTVTSCSSPEVSCFTAADSLLIKTQTCALGTEFIARYLPDV